MKYLPILAFTVALVSVADIAVAKTLAEIESIAKAVTVEIRLLKAESVGSGIIIERQGDLYTLITNRHVVCGQTRNCTTPPSAETYTVKLGDGQKYQVSAKSVKLLGNNLDLAIVQFRSNRGYPVALVADPGSLKVDDIVYTSGYPAEPPGFSFNIGSAIAVVNKRLTEDRGGYTIMYTTDTQPGMSGGGVFNREGRLVAIHGQGERSRENTELRTVSSSGVIFRGKQDVGSKIGFNRGIPVNWVVQGLAQSGIRLGNRQSVDLRQTAATGADEHFIAGFNKFMEPGSDVFAGKQAAISEFSQAIKINPGYLFAYILRAITYRQLGEAQRAVADYDRVIAIEPLSTIYTNRGSLKHYKLNDFQGALADYDRAIALNPKDVLAYHNRGNLKQYEFNNPQGALADYNRAIALDPNFAIVYSSRGNLKSYKLNDSQGALADYDRAIALDPNLVSPYGSRGLLKYTKLSDRSSGITDVRQAAKLARSQGDSRSLQIVLKILQSWGVGE
jgi:tetratricopeptide (TPR) repeat protein